MFHNDISISVKSKVLYRISVLLEILEKNLKNKNNLYKGRGLEFSHKTEMYITFATCLHLMTYKHYIEQPMPMVEKVFTKVLYKKIMTL